MTAWLATLDALKLAIPSSAFNHLLAGSQIISDDAVGGFVIGVRNPSAVEWLRGPYYDLVSQALSEQLGQSVPVRYEVGRGASDNVRSRTQSASGNSPTTPPPPALPGFPDISQNWTKCPDFYFDVVLLEASPACFKVVGAVIRNTLGRRDKRGNAAQWWCGVSYRLLSKRTGIKNRSSLAAAIWDARANGWIKRKPGGKAFDYALRWEDEQIDIPKESRPARS